AGIEVPLHRVECPNPNALYLVYKLPDEFRRRLLLRFELSVNGFQPRSHHAFPIFISEPTRGATMDFSYAAAAIENVAYFVGMSVLPPASQRPERRAVPEHDSNGKYFQLKSSGVFLNPGEGVVVYWTPLLHPDRITLVNLDEINRGTRRCLIAPPY